ncbi:hypothetical protein [Terrabacter sp. Ter38]|uniref:hypothetical protein n=1 Tax=Terrabacter sp. Ter38 TaxID=2926030 RepID=UPI002118C6A1|nr:hypothetical protein [Terrabacter sp. Ter38]
MSTLPDGYRDKLPDDVLVELAEQLADLPPGPGHSEGVEPWPCHVVAVCIGGDNRYYTLCEDCLHRDGPFDDALDAERVVLQHRWITKVAEGGAGHRGFDACT